MPSPAVYQTVNAGLAVAACRLLLGALDAGAARRALAATAVPGRLQVAGRAPLLLADGAHNPDGVRALAAALETVERPAPRVGVLAIMADKAVEEMLRRAAAAGRRGGLHAGQRGAQPDGRRACRRACGRAAGRSAARTARRRTSSPTRTPPSRWLAAWPAAGGSVLVAGSLYLLADLADLLAGGGAGSGGVY